MGPCDHETLNSSGLSPESSRNHPVQIRGTDNRVSIFEVRDMGSKCKSIKHLRERCLDHCSDKQSLQWRSYYSWLPQRLRKMGYVKVYPSSKIPSHSLLFSTLQKQSTESKIGFLRWYLGKLESHPLMTKSITASLIFAAADLTCQVRACIIYESILLYCAECAFNFFLE